MCSAICGARLARIAAFTALNTAVVSGAFAQDTADGATTYDSDQIIVSGTQEPYFQLGETATKSDRDLLNTPLSVTILNENFLNDLRAETLADAYPYTVGLSQSGTNANNFTLRGLPSDLQNIQINGLPGLASRFGSPTTASIERVEVLKGPASVLYGLMEPGGLINIVTKRPEAASSVSVSATGQTFASANSEFGNDVGTTITFDATGPLTSDDRLLFRLIASYEYLQSFRDGVTNENFYIFPSLSYHISDAFQVTAGIEYTNEKGDADDGLAAVNNDIDLIAPITVRYQEDGDFDNDEGLVLFANAELEISDSTLARLNYRSVFHTDERKLFENNRVNDADDPLDSTLRRRDRHQLNKRAYHFLDLNIAHKISTGALRHNLLVGVNGGFERSDFERIRFGTAVTPNISIFDPEFGVSLPSEITPGNDRITDRWNYGLYAQNTIDIGDRWSVMIGGRFDRQDVDFVEQVSNVTETQTTEAFLPQGGIVFKPSAATSLYASYTKSFSPNSVERRSAEGESFEPERGRQFEIGAKASLWDERVNVTIAGFDIEKTNILERDNDGNWALLGELQSRGVEFELQALPLEHWQIRVGYAYVDSIISASPTEALVGARNAFAPEHDGFIWTRFNYPTAIFGGRVGASFGLNFESERFTNASTTTQVALPSSVRADVGLYYETERLSLALNIENLWDETYFIGGSTDRSIFPGKPRLITLSAKTTF